MKRRLINITILVAWALLMLAMPTCSSNTSDIDYEPQDAGHPI